MADGEHGESATPTGHTTVAVQRYLDALALAADAPADSIVRDLLGRSVERLQRLCRKQLRRGYPRLTVAPMGIETDDVLAAIVERLLHATRDVRPGSARQFFGLANRHIRWELNSLARSRDEAPRACGLPEDVVQPEVTDSGITHALRQMLAAIEDLPDDDREAFDLVRVQGLSHAEAADVVGVSTKTVQRRLHDALAALSERVEFLAPPEGMTPSA